MHVVLRTQCDLFFKMADSISAWLAFVGNEFYPASKVSLSLCCTTIMRQTASVHRPASKSYNVYNVGTDASASTINRKQLATQSLVLGTKTINMHLNLLFTASLISLASSAALLLRQDQAKLGTSCTSGAKMVCSMIRAKTLMALEPPITLPQAWLTFLP